MVEPAVASEGAWSVEQCIPKDLEQELVGSSNKGNFYFFLHILKRLKTTKRTGWLNFNVENAESIADHMYRMGIISMCATDKALDTGRCVKMALVHDMAESLVGDITPEDNVSKEEKHRRELLSIEYLCNILEPFNAAAAEEIKTLWNEYEAVSTQEARFVKDVDKFELMVQTLEEERRYEGRKDLSVFMSVRSQIKTPQVCDLADGIIAERKKFWESINSNK
jgi:putative hydrolase of HD superfamily